MVRRVLRAMVGLRSQPSTDEGFVFSLIENGSLETVAFGGWIVAWAVTGALLIISGMLVHASSITLRRQVVTVAAILMATSVMGVIIHLIRAAVAVTAGQSLAVEKRPASGYDRAVAWRPRADSGAQIPLVLGKYVIGDAYGSRPAWSELETVTFGTTLHDETLTMAMSQTAANKRKPEGRRARAVLLRSDGRALGCLPAIDLAEPWWMGTTDLLAALRERFGLDGIVLRLVSASTTPFESGAEVTYAVELIGELPPRLPLAHCDHLVLGADTDPRRMPWARLGGVAADIGWADRELGKLGWRRTGPAAQVRSWNLSLLLRLPSDRGIIWLKHVPPFLRHEGSILRLVHDAGASVPAVLVADARAGLVLLDDVPGEDQYFPDEQLTVRMVESLVHLQRRMRSRRDAILAADAPDWTGATLLRDVSHLAARDDVRAELNPAEQVGLDRLLTSIPARLDALYASGLEDTLVHGDFHPANHRFDGRKLVLLDWGDSGIGHPLLDMTSFLRWVPPERLDRVRAAWIAAWKDAYPSADVSRAAELIRPIAALRLALIYRRFLDGIEESEQIYHRDDPAAWLRRAIAVVTT
ncbi:MAG TPA: aminoglycoside phosphotransferase family protein [Candidatus Dormibacteraeota bacterium]|nr:aminoglycoside phosphotransferase family protein [Candidatus Dormibacteraeota bacterium]